MGKTSLHERPSTINNSALEDFMTSHIILLDEANTMNKPTKHS